MSYIENKKEYNEITENLKSNLAVLSLRLSVKELERMDINNSNQNLLSFYKKTKFLRVIFLISYIFLPFFELPFWCYNKQDKCDPQVITIGIPFLGPYIYRPLELLMFLFMFLFVHLRYKTRVKTRTFLIRFYAINILAFGCILDIIINLIINQFPFFNFIARCFLIIIISRTLREEWLKIFRVLWNTKSVFLILMINWLIFSLIGHLFFRSYPDDHDFITYFGSVDTMFVLLTTCNFPDVMIKLIDSSKLPIIFFITYLLINTILILGLLKALYYANYHEITKIQTKLFLDKLENNKIELNTCSNIDRLKKSFYSTKLEYEKFQFLLQSKETSKENLIDDLNEESKSINLNNTYIPFVIKLMNKRSYEIFMNILNFCSIILIILDHRSYTNKSVLIIQLLISVLYAVEYLVLMKYLGCKKMCRHYLRTVFFIINIYIIITHSVFLIYDFEKNLIKVLVKFGILMRFIRIKFLLDCFPEFTMIFDTIESIKMTTLYHLGTLWSFFYLFSSITMLIVGGTIKINQFDNNDQIPKFYKHINFNDFGYSYICCFALLMVNNMSIITDAVTSQVGYGLKAYFTIFYFIACILILNICHTYILDMYLNLKNSKEKGIVGINKSVIS